MAKQVQQPMSVDQTGQAPRLEVVVKHLAISLKKQRSCNFSHLRDRHLLVREGDVLKLRPPFALLEYPQH